MNICFISQSSTTSKLENNMASVTIFSKSDFLDNLVYLDDALCTIEASAELTKLAGTATKTTKAFFDKISIVLGCPPKTTFPELFHHIYKIRDEAKYGKMIHGWSDIASYLASYYKQLLHMRETATAFELYSWIVKQSSGCVLEF
jgi:hypothetical protein